MPPKVWFPVPVILMETGPEITPELVDTFAPYVYEPEPVRVRVEAVVEEVMVLLVVGAPVVAFELIP